MTKLNGMTATAPNRHKQNFAKPNLYTLNDFKTPNINMYILTPPMNRTIKSINAGHGMGNHPASKILLTDKGNVTQL